MLPHFEYPLRIQHRHDDESWGEMTPEPETRDPDDLDSEREWQDGRVYRCTTCDETVRITPDREPEGLTGP